MGEFWNKTFVDAPTFWTAVGAIAQGFASILGLGALIYSIRSFRSAERNMQASEQALRKSIQDSYYVELDRLLFDLLAIAAEKPHLMRNEPVATDAEPGGAEFDSEYDHYAWMVWNFIETIADRVRGDPTLEETWIPAMLSLNAVHREWFDQDCLRHPSVRRFKDSFVAYVREKLPPAHEVRRHLIVPCDERSGRARTEAAQAP